MKYKYGYVNPAQSPRLTPKSAFLKSLEKMQRDAAKAREAINRDLAASFYSTGQYVYHVYGADDTTVITVPVKPPRPALRLVDDNWPFASRTNVGKGKP